jgi:perosamine synthetase
VQRRLKEAGIETRRFFSPVHSQPIVGTGGVDSDFPRATELAERGLYLPSFIGMGAERIERVSRLLCGLNES